MSVKHKLKEAQFFYGKLSASNNDEEFIYFLSAFLSSARSVLQYIHKEASDKPNGQAWYDRYVSSSSILAYFKDKRNINIHERPVKPTRNLKIKDKSSLSISESVTITSYENGVKVDESFHDLKDQLNEKKSESSVENYYSFEDWESKESVTELCNKYLDELKDILSSGINNEYISS
jgi:hypothetical protein